MSEIVDFFGTVFWTTFGALIGTLVVIGVSTVVIAVMS